MLDMRSRSRLVARFMDRPTRIKIESEIGTSTRNISVSCQLMRQATTTHASARSGSATTRPNRVLRPFPIISVSFVKRDINSCVPCSPNWATSILIA